MKKRARDDEDKLKRRHTLLAAASSLLNELSFHNISVASVARSAGLAKGTVYIYFKTKEEIFIALLQEQMLEWLAAISAAADALEPDRVVGTEVLVNATVDFLAGKEQFLYLASSSQTVLEHNLSYEVAVAYKMALATGLTETGTALERVLELGEGQGRALLMQSYALTIGFWQMANPPKSMAEALEKEELHLFKHHFSVDLKVSMKFLWQGFLAATSQ